MVAVVRTAFAQLHWVHQLWANVNWEAVIITQLDYCKCTLPRVTFKDHFANQLVQNAAACFLFGTSGQEDKIPMMQALHWLPTGFQVQFEILVLTNKLYMPWH